MKLIPILSGYFKRGEILFEGKDLVPLSEKEMQNVRGKEIGMIFQDPMTSLNPTMKVGKQITEVLFKHEKISKEAAKNARLNCWN